MEKGDRLKESKFYDKLDKFCSVIQSDAELWPIFSGQVERMQSIVESPLKIAVMGEFKAGKSSFVNSLLGKTELLPVGVIPKTATINELIYGEKAQTTICYKDKSRETHDGYAILEHYNQASEQDNVALAHELERVERIIVMVDAEYLKRFTIIDTPGFNQADAEALDKKSLSILSEVDLVIWLFRAGQCGSRTELSYLEKIKGTVQNLYAVFNRIDEVDVEPTVLSKSLADHFRGVFVNETNVHGICANPNRRGANADLALGFDRLISDLNLLIFNEDYKLSLERLKSLHSSICNTAADCSQYLDGARERIEQELEKFKSKAVIFPDNQASPYAMKLKARAKKLAEGFVAEVSSSTA